MKDRDKTREQLIQELTQMRQRVDGLESSSARHEDEAPYRRLVESSIDWVWTVDLDGNHTFTNRAIESFLGYQPAEILGVPAYQFIHPEDREPIQQLVQHSIEQKTGWSKVTIRWLHKDGTVRYSESSGQPILDPEGQLTGFSGIDRDITERKELEEELAQYRGQLEQLVETRTAQLQSVVAEHKQAEERLRILSLVVEQTDNPIAILDNAHNVEYANKAFLEINQYTPEQVLGKHWQAFVSTQSSLRELFLEILETATHSEQVWHGELSGVDNDGQQTWRQGTVFPIKDAQGELTHLVYISEDITARKQAEAALRESEERYRDLYAAMNEGAGLYELVYGPSGEPEDYRVLDINPAYETLTGLTREEVVGRTASEIFPGTRPRYLDLYAQVVASGKPTAFETYFPPWDKYISVSVFSPEKEKFATTFIDISARKRNEENLRQYTERLKILHEIDRAILKAQSPQATAEAALQYIRQLIPCHRITVGIYDFTTRERVMLVSNIAGETVLGKGERHPLDMCWVDILRQGKPLVVKDLRSVPEPLPAYQPLLDSGMRALISTPLVVQDDLIGSLNLMMTESQVFTEDHVEIACEVADELAIAIWQANLHEQIQHNAAQLEALRKVTLDITAQLDLDNLLEAIIRNAVDLMDVQGGGITLYRPDRDLLEWVVGINLAHIPIGLEIRRGEGHAGQIWERGEPVYVDNYSEWEHHKPGYEDLHGAIGVPIQWGGEFLGTIAVTQRSPTARALSEGDSQLLELFAHQAAIAIQNVRLYEEVQRHASTLEERVSERTAELAEAKQQTETILQNIGDAVVLTDVEGNILYANPAWESLTGYTLEEVTKQNASVLKSGTTPGAVYETMWQTILGGDTWRGVLQNKRKDGTPYDSELTIAPVKDEQGQIDHFVGVMRDVTEERQLAAMKEQFIADAAHDLGNPVAVLQTSLYLLKKDPSQLDRRLARFEHEINRLTGLVKDLLTISRLDRNAIDTRMELQDLNTIVRQVVESQSSLASERKLTLSFDAEQNLPNILIDGKQIERVVVNLVGNALNYTGEGGQVRVRTMQEGDWMVLVVKDTGIGISPRDLGQIFERFYRADIAKSTADGTGLGLPIVKEIIDLHGGRIEVESEEGQGSTFRVLLPIIR